MSVAVLYFIVKLQVDVTTVRPYYFRIFNLLNSGLYGILGWAAFIQLICVIRGDPSDDILLWVLLGGSFIAVGVGVALCIWQEKKYSYTRWIEEAPEDENKEIGGYVTIRPFRDENEVDVIVRDIIRNAHRDEMWVEKVSSLYSSALQTFGSSSRMHISYSIFLDMIKEDKSGSKLHLDQALRCSPNIQDRFVLYVNEQESKKQHAATSAGDSSMDLVSYIEFQGYYSNALKSHRRLLNSIKYFWRIICRTDDPSIETLSKVFDDVDKLEETTARIYRGLLRKYPKSIPLLRSYAAFLIGVLNENRKARKYSLEADRLEEAAEQIKKESSFGDFGNTGTGAVDDKTDAIIMINDSGIILSANKNTSKLFGYHEKDLLNHNISMIMPSPHKQQHNVYLSKYKQTRKSNVIGHVRRLEAEHKRGYTFSIELRVSKVDSPMGTTFVGIIHAVKDELQTGMVSINTAGKILSVNKILVRDV
jgi:PAS domain S-box-containing protein